MRHATLGITPILHLRLRDDVLGRVEVALVAKHEEGEVTGVRDVGRADELVTPVAELRKRGSVANIVHKNACVRTPIERKPEALKPLLTRRVPQLAGGRWGSNAQSRCVSPKRHRRQPARSRGRPRSERPSC